MLVANASYAFALGAFLINIRNTDINSKIEEIVVIYDGDFDIEGLNKIDNRLKETLQNPALISAHKDFYLLRRTNSRSPPC